MGHLLVALGMLERFTGAALTAKTPLRGPK